MIDNETKPLTDLSIYAVRAKKKAKTIVVAGMIASLFSLALFLFFLLFPPDDGRDYLFLFLMACWAIAGAFFAYRGYNTVRRIKSPGQL